MAKKKFKIRYVKFLFSHRHYRGEDWAKSPPADYHFGNRHTEKLHQFNYTQNYISTIFSDELNGDPRKWDKKAKFSESEASILLLKYLESNLKDARKEKKRLDQLEIENAKYPPLPDNLNIFNSGLDYARSVNNRALGHLVEACKIWRKKVKLIKASPEYLWEQMLK